MPSTLTRVAVVLLIGAALAACDSGRPGLGGDPPGGVDPPGGGVPPGAELWCGAVAERTETAGLALGDSLVFRLPSQAGAALTYTVDSASRSWAQGREGSVLIRPTYTGVRNLVIHVSKDCRSAGGGAAERVARVTVLVVARPHGVACDAAPTVREPSPVRLAVGGLSVRRPGFGTGGLFEGDFAYGGILGVRQEPSGFVRAFVQGSEIDVAPLHDGSYGSGVLRVDAVDSCARRAVAEVPVSVIDSPTCSVDYDPADADYLPLAVGFRWRYAGVSSWYNYNTPPPHSGSSTFEETWQVVSEGACRDGARTYGIAVQVGSDPLSSMTFTVRGDSVVIGHRRVAGTVRHRYPADSPERVLIGGGSGYGRPARSWTLRRQIGVEIMSEEHITHTIGNEYRLNLVEFEAPRIGRRLIGP